jgi:toxin secretion/phage lysis holin
VGNVKKAIEIISGLAGAVISFFTGLPPIIWILVAVESMDYITGLICGFMGVSPKTETGGLSSNAAFKGLLKKVLILLVVGLAALVDKAVGQIANIEIVAVTGATCLWFVASEGLSVLENAAAMGVPIPKVLLKALEIIRRQGEDGEEKKPPDEEEERR